MKKLFIAFFCALGMTSAVFAIEASISMEPKIPEPYSQVTLRVNSYNIDVDTSMVVWKVNGVETKKGVGEKTLSLKVGPVGSSAPVSVTVTDDLGNSLEAMMNVKPQSVTLLWEAVESYTPPFYEGKALPAAGAKVRVVSLADMGSSAGTLAYSWFEGDEARENSSGVAKNSFTLNLDILQSRTKVKSRVRSSGGDLAEKTIEITPHDVMPMLYSHDELLGTNLAKSFVRRVELAKEITLSFEPFYLSTKGLESTASYSWYLDGLPVTPNERTILSLRPKENSYGVRTLTIKAQQTKRRLQTAESSLQIVFDTRN